MSKANQTFTDRWPQTLNSKILTFLKKKEFKRMTPVQVVKESSPCSVRLLLRLVSRRSQFHSFFNTKMFASKRWLAVERRLPSSSLCSKCFWRSTPMKVPSTNITFIHWLFLRHVNWLNKHSISPMNSFNHSTINSISRALDLSGGQSMITMLLSFKLTEEPLSLQRRVV